MDRAMEEGSHTVLGPLVVVAWKRKPGE